MGLRSAYSHASAAFLASQTQCQPLVAQLLDLDTVAPTLSTQEALHHLSNILKLDEPLTVDHIVGNIMQRETSRRVD